MKSFYRAVVADKKPYFMRYIYPALMKQYNTYIKNANKNALREFKMTIAEMRDTPYKELSDEQRDFLRYYDYRMPVGVGDCVMNKICRRFEMEFDGCVRRHNASTHFDYSIMRGDAQYTRAQKSAIKTLCDNYNKQLRSFAIFAKYERVDECETSLELDLINDEFKKNCESICSDEGVLCNIILDICYTRNSTKKFAWAMCGDAIIQNLLNRNKNIISFPTYRTDGDIYFGGSRYVLETKEIGVA